MAAQVLVRGLPFGKIDGDNDPPPLNAEICHFENIHCCRRRRIVSTKESPSCLRRVLISDNPYEDIDFCVSTSEGIFRAMALNFFICPRPSRSGLVVIKV